MTRVLTQFIVVVALCVGLTGCSVSPTATASELLGTWSSIEASEPTITFNRDQTYGGTDFPPAFLCSGEVEPGPSSGTWRMNGETKDGLQEILIVSELSGCGLPLSVERLDGELRLTMWIGDPDEDEAITFSRA